MCTQSLRMIADNLSLKVSEVKRRKQQSRLRFIASSASTQTDFSTKEVLETEIIK